MITTAYADYMNSNTYRRYLDAEDNCRAAFRIETTPVKPAVKKRFVRRTGEFLRYTIGNIEEIVGMAVEFDKSGAVSRLEIAGRDIENHIYYTLREDLGAIVIDAGGKVDVKRYNRFADHPNLVGMPIRQWQSDYAGVELEEVIDIVQRAVDYYGGAEALAA